MITMIFFNQINNNITIVIWRLSDTSREPLYTHLALCWTEMTSGILTGIYFHQSTVWRGQYSFVRVWCFLRAKSKNNSKRKTCQNTCVGVPSARIYKNTYFSQNHITKTVTVFESTPLSQADWVMTYDY